MLDLLIVLIVLVLSFLIGYRLISKVPPLLHTPLMSMTNAVSAVVVIGALLLFSAEPSGVEKVIGAVALIMAAFNLVGGLVITDRMLNLFKSSEHDR